MKRIIADKHCAEKIYQSILDDVMTKLSEDICKELSTEDVTVIAAYVGDKKNQLHGQLIGYAELKRPVIITKDDIQIETSYLCFYYTIANNNHKGTNYMTNISLDLPVDYDIQDDDLFKELNRASHVTERIPWGGKGFWEHTPTKTLTGDDLACRLFIEKVQSVSRKYEWAKHIRKSKSSLKVATEKKTKHKR